MVKSLQRSIRRMFITGISPLSLTDIGSGFNVAANISFDERAAGLCGLARTDIEAALKICCTNEDYQRHLSTMTKYLNGFHFCDQKKAEAIYNTDTCLSCLQVIHFGSLLPSIADSRVVRHRWNGATSPRPRQFRGIRRVFREIFQFAVCNKGF